MRPPTVLTIAGSDSGGGAGIQADLKTCAAHGVFGMSAITAVTAQNTRAVTAVATLEPEMVAAQIDAVFDDLPVDAVKIGMLGTPAIVDVVAACLDRHRPPHVVLDPVMIAKSGDALLSPEACRALRGTLLPLATLVTPNLPEARELAGEGEDRPASSAVLEQLAAALVACGPAVLIKGGHAPDDAEGQVVDLLHAEGRLHRFRHARIATPNTHGTGCTLSAAIACRLARGDALPVAVGGAIDYLHGAIAAAGSLGGGHGPVDHLYLQTVPA